MFRRVFVAVAMLAVVGFVVSTAEAKKKGPVTEANGKVKAIDMSASTITLEGKKDKQGNPKPDTEFKFDKSTVKVTNGTDAKKIEDVIVGSNVHLELAEDGRTVKAIDLAGGKKKDK